MSNLQLKFREKDSPLGVSRETLKALAKELEVAETMVVHLALASYAKDVLPGYEADDGALSQTDLGMIRDRARGALPKGKAISTKSLI